MSDSNWKEGLFWAGAILVVIVVMAVAQDVRVSWPLVIVLILAVSRPVIRHVVMPKVRGAGRRSRKE